MTAPGSGTLEARAQPAPTGDPLLPPDAGYQRLENQLYRVEIHQASSSGSTAPTFKWSRENGSVVTAVELEKPIVTGNQLVVQSLGSDGVLGFADDQWIEIVDDSTERRGEPRQLLQIETVDGPTRKITLKGNVPSASDLGSHPKLRRWDQSGVTATEHGVAITEDFQALEDGVEVSFSDGAYKAGDYWLIPARTATGDIEWPFDIPQPPFGIKHHYCRLAEVVVQGTQFGKVSDLRDSFNTLADNLIVQVVVVDDANPLGNGSAIKGSELARGLEISLNRMIDPASATRAACFVTLELPFLVELPLGAATRRQMVGFQPLVLAATVQGNDPMKIAWNPVPATQDYLKDPLSFLALPAFTTDWELLPADVRGVKWKYSPTGARRKLLPRLDPWDISLTATWQRTHAR